MEEKLYNLALKFLSYRPRSEKEVYDYLIRKSSKQRHSGEPRSAGRLQNRFWSSQNDDIKSTIEKVVSKLKKYKFIDDEKFARMFVEDRLKFKPRSTRLIKLELKQKGIYQETIDNLQLTIDEVDLAKKLIEKKIRSRNKFGMTNDEVGMTNEKLGRYLLSKGFSWDVIRKVIGHVQFHERG
jgi:regulatory protein